MRYTTIFFQSRTCIVFMVAVLAIFSYAIIVNFVIASYPFNVPRNFVVDPVPVRRDLARKILKIQREIQFEAGFDNGVHAAWAEGLLAIVAELDPRVMIAEKEQRSLQSNRIDGVEALVNETLTVCPEVYKGRESDFWYENNFLEVQCKAKKFKEVLTVVISGKGWDNQRLGLIITNIKEHYDVDIVVLTYGGTIPQFVDSERVIIKKFNADTLESFAFNSITPTISTPYTLVVHSVVHFNSHSPLERLVRVLEDMNEVSVASGAYRDIIGHWHHGCLQVVAEDYDLRYIRGYEHSYLECMYCDDVLGPFVAESDLLKRVPMTETMDGSVMFRDWFLNVRLSGKLVVTCPDVMFFVKAEPSISKSDWLQISQKWSLEHIGAFDGQNFEFSCVDAQISCVNIMKTVSSFLLPPCCREKIRWELGFVQECADEIGAYYELQAGTLLGAVKMDGILPWDFDTDIITDCSEQQIWMTKGFECMDRKGCLSKLQSGNYWTSSCSLSVIDITCRANRTITLPAEYQQIATQIELNGRWTKVTSNPGRSTRNRYGPEYLKHAVHWRYSTNSTAPKDDGTGQSPGLWSSCSEPAFHSCLDHFPVDGNIRFKNSACRNP